MITIAKDNAHHRPAICTITTRSHLGLAQCLMDSFVNNHPDGAGYVLCLDDVPPSDEIHGTAICSLRPRELCIPQFADMLARYNTFEMCNALKPFLLQHLIAHTDHRKLCYFDSDIFIFAPLNRDVWDPLDSCSILLTPHLCRLPENDPDLVWRDLAVLQHGVYNGGFIGVRRCPEAHEFLRWWSSRIIPCGYKKLEEGMNCDQRWLDLLPGFALNARISRHPGLNAGYWNLHERHFGFVDGRHFVNGEPLGFFHFSGYSPHRPDLITKNWTRFTFENRPDVRPVFNEYRRHLEHVLQELAGNTRQAHVILHSTPTSPAESALPVTLEIPAQHQTPIANNPPDNAPAAAPTPALIHRQFSLSPRVSVVIPAFNAARYIRQAIDSALEQTLEDLEIVVVDDGSTDDTRSILAAYGDKIRLISQSHSGVSAARNRGIDAGRGAFVAFLDADDYFLLPSKLEEQIACFEQQPNLAIMHSGWRIIDENDSAVVEKQPWLHAPDLDLKDWLLFQPALPSAMMFRRDALLAVGGFDCRFAHLEDVELALRLSRHGYHSAWLKNITTAYRRHGGNASLDAGAQAEALAALLDKFFAEPGLPETIISLEPEVRYNALVWAACRYHHVGQFDKMVGCLLQSLRYSTQPTSAAFLDWIDRFRCHYADDLGVRLSTFDLTDLVEWQWMVRSQLFGITPDEAFFPAASKKPLLVWSLSVGQERPTTQTKTFNGRSYLTENNGVPRQQKACAYPAKLNLGRALTNDYGRHRSGWMFALQSLKELHHDNGALVDAFLEHTFDRGQGKPQYPHRAPWVGFLHNPPAIPHWFVYHQSPQSLLANEAFQESMKSCLGLFCLSDYHKRWLENHLRVPIIRLLHPTSTPEKQFSIESFLANTDKKIIQVGSWLRKLHSIYFLPVKRLKRAIAHQHLPYIEDLFAAEKKEFQLEPDYGSVEVLSFLSNAQYDDLLSRNIVYLELYDSSANNTVIECIMRNTPILINPLPAVREYLGDEYPFYFTNRNQAARKAEDAALIEKTHRYLQTRPIKEQLTPEYFLQSVVESEIYRNLPCLP